MYATVKLGVETAFLIAKNTIKFLNKLRCNLPKIQTKGPNLKIFCQKHANGIAKSEDTDLGLHCLPRPICPKTVDHYGKFSSGRNWKVCP